MKLPKLFKKGQSGLNAMSGIIITFVIVAVVAVLGLQLLSDQQDDLTANTTEYNATVDAIEGVSKFPEKLPMIAGVFVLAIIIGVLGSLFLSRR